MIRISKERRRRWLRRAAVAALIPLLLVLIAWCLIHTPPGRRVLAGTLSTVASSFTRFDISIRDLGGTLPFHPRIGAVEVSDEDGVFVTVRAIDVACDAGALAHGALHLPAVTVEEVKVLRAPVSHGLRRWWRLPFAIASPPRWFQADAITILSIVLGPGLESEPVRLRADGNAGPVDNDRWRLHLSCPDAAGNPLVGLVEAEYSNEGLAASLDFTNGCALPERFANINKVRFTLHGKGNADAWLAVADAQVNDAPLLHTAFAANVAGPLALSGALELDTAHPLLPEKCRTLFGEKPTLAFQCEFDRGEPWTFQKLEARLPAGTVALTGILGGKQDTPLPGGLPAFQFEGSAEIPKMEVFSTLFHAPPLDGAIQAQLKLNNTAEGIRLEADGRAEDIAYAAYPPVSCDLALDATRQPDGAIAIARAAVSEHGVELSVTGSVDVSGPQFSGTLRLKADDLAEAAALAKLPLAGPLEITAETVASPEAITLNAHGATDGLHGLPEPFATFVHQAATLEAAAAWRDGALKLERFDYATAWLKAHGNGAWTKASSALEVKLALTCADLAPAGKALSHDLAGTLEANLSAKGTLANLDVACTADAKKLRVDAASADLAHAEAKLANALTDPKGAFKLRVEARGKKLDAESAVQRDGAEWRFTKTRLKAGGNKADGDAAFDPKTNAARGKFTLALDDLAYFGKLLDMPLAGSAQLTADFEATPDNARATVQGKARNVTLPGATLERADGKAALRNIYTRPEGDAEIHVTGLDAGGVHVAKSDVAFAGGADTARIQATFDGALPRIETFSGDTTATFDWAAGKGVLESAQGKIGAYPFSLDAPAALAFGKNTAALETSHWHTGEGTLSLAAARGKQGIRVDASWDGIPAGMVFMRTAAERHGRIGGAIAVDGLPQAPTGTASVTLKGMYAGPEADNAPALSAEATADIAPNAVSFQANAALAGFGEARANGTVPLATDPRGLPDLAWDQPLAGAFSGNLDLNGAARFFHADGHQLEGRIESDFALEGTPASPNLSGSAKLEGGRYENAQFGTVLQDIVIRVKAKDRELRMTELNANDGEGGTLVLYGKITADPQRHFPIEMHAECKGFRAIRRPNLQACLDATANLAGDMAHAAMSADTTLQEVVLKLPDKLPEGQLPNIAVVEINGPAKEDKKEKNALPLPMTFPEVALDATIHAPDTIAVRSNLLESTWGGDLHAAGTLREPRLKGALRVARGRVEFLGRQFTLAGSTISFDGSPGFAPYIEAAAKTQTQDVTAILSVTGKPDAMTFDLNSEPAMPKDEIIARVLFGRTLAQITPVQAVQLARVAAMLGGAATRMPLRDGLFGFGLLDNIDVRAGDTPGETVVGVGAYITDRVYTEVEQGTKTGDTGAKVKVDITPELSVEAETKTGATPRTGLGVMWKKDY